MELRLVDKPRHTLQPRSGRGGHRRGFDVWRVSPGTDTPAVGVNMTNVTITPACCDPIPPGSSNVHPGPGGENAIVRWTAPTGGTYQVFASFSGGDMAGTTTDVAVLKNSSTSLYIAEVTGFGPSSAQTFSGNVTVVAGDTLDFTVGFGTDQNYYSDGTYLTVTIKTLVNAQVQQPINADGTSVFSVRRGVVPVKFTLMDNGIATCTLPPATIAVTRTAGGTTGQIDESVYTLSADTGSNFRIDSCQYVYNLSASALGGGTYRVDIQINGQVVGSGIFQLK